jgi:hypothetical protein
VYVANIDKKVEREDVRTFFERVCGERCVRLASARGLHRLPLEAVTHSPTHIHLCDTHPSWPSTHATGKIGKIRLLGDVAHSTRIVFIEFIQAEAAMAALNCSGALLGESLG